MISQASTGAKRETPGKLSGSAPEPEDTPAEVKTIDDYLKVAEEWRERLAQVRRWLEEMGGPPESDQDPESL